MKYPMFASSTVGETLTQEEKETMLKEWKEKHSNESEED